MIWDPVADDLPDTGGLEYRCGRGEIRRLSSGLSFASLDDALAVAEVEDGFCLGAGQHDVGPLTWEPGGRWGAGSSLRLVGAGAGETVLVGAISAVLHGQANLTLDIDGSVELEGLSFERLPLCIMAGRAQVTDLSFISQGDSAQLFTVSSPDIEGDGIVVRDMELAGVLPVLLYGVGTVRGLEIVGNQVAPGTLLQTYLDIELIEPVITGNLAFGDELGSEGIQAYGDLSIIGGELSGNSFDGPLIHARALLELQDVWVHENLGLLQGTVTVDKSAVVRGGGFVGNQARSGAFSLSETSIVEFLGVDFGIGEDRNIPCDVAMMFTGDLDAQCIGLELGAGSTVTCDGGGCR